MPNQVLDMRCFSFEQATRVGETFVLAEFLKDFVGMAYAHGNGSIPTAEQAGAGWKLSWRLEPTPRIQVRTFEPKFQEMVKAILVARGYEVRDKDDHLVVIL